MKRLPFKPEFVPDVQARRKRFTSRWDLKYSVGDIVECVTAQNGKPAFLTPAKDAFATARIVSIQSMFWKDFTDEHAALCTVTREWYLKERPGAGEFDRIHLIGFEVVEE